MAFCVNDRPALISILPLIIALYAVVATSRGVAVFSNKEVLSIPDVLPKPVSVAPGIKLVTVILVCDNS